MTALCKVAVFCCYVVTLFFLPSKTSDVISTDEFFHRVALRDNFYELYWNYDDEYMTFLVFARTRGYISFGFSPDGKLRGSDFFIAGVEDRDPYYDDYHINWDYDEEDERDEYRDRLYRLQDGERHVMPDTDWVEDWELLEARENFTHTGVKFRRRFETCDLEEDVIITNGTMRLLWGYGDEDSISAEGMVRGNQSVFLKAAQTTKPQLPYDAFVWEFRASNARVTASGHDTWCQAIEIPYLRQKHHIVLFEPLLQNEHESLVNHISLYGCRPPRQSVTQQEMTARGDCNIVRHRVNYCTATLYSWGSGGGPLYLPDNVGLPMGDADQPTYFLLELHYKPHHLQATTDRSGVRLTLTATLRPYDAGIMEVGHVARRALMIPPRMENFTVQGFCPSKCLLQAASHQQFYGPRTSNTRFGIPRRQPDRTRNPDRTGEEVRPEVRPGEQANLPPKTGDTRRNGQQGPERSQQTRNNQDRYDQERYGQRSYGPRRYGPYGQDDYDEKGISVFANLLRVRGVGRKVRLRHIRNGIEMMVVDGDENYDTSLQEIRLLPEERVVMPTDDLIVECTYNTTEKATVTWGGGGITEEMCSSVLYYYPKIALSKCQTFPLAEELFSIVGNQRTSMSSWQSDVKRISWSYVKSKRLEQLEKRAKRHVVCETVDGIEYPIAREILRKPIGVSLPQPWPQRRCGSGRVHSFAFVYLVILASFQLMHF